MIESDSQVATTGGDYTCAWNDYRRRRRWYFGTWLGSFAVIEILWHLSDKVSLRGLAIGVLGPICMLTFIIFCIWHGLFKCPRCGRCFFLTWLYHNHFARHCVHCGLSKWAKTNSPEKNS